MNEPRMKNLKPLIAQPKFTVQVFFICMYGSFHCPFIKKQFYVYMICDKIAQCLNQID